MVSDECKDLIKKMLVIDPQKRLTAQQVLKHDWFVKFADHQQVAHDVDALDPEVFSRMASFKPTSYFEKVAMNILIKQSKDSEFLDLKKQFEIIDKDGTGLITPQELKEYI